MKSECLGNIFLGEMCLEIFDNKYLKKKYKGSNIHDILVIHPELLKKFYKNI